MSTHYTIVHISNPARPDPNIKIDLMVDWCIANVGNWETDWMWEYEDGTIDNANCIFYFADTKHATAFTLRWA